MEGSETAPNEQRAKETTNQTGAESRRLNLKEENRGRETRRKDQSEDDLVPFIERL